jgi:hypothetical protein
MNAQSSTVFEAGDRAIYRGRLVTVLADDGRDSKVLVKREEGTVWVWRKQLTRTEDAS